MRSVMLITKVIAAVREGEQAGTRLVGNTSNDYIYYAQNVLKPWIENLQNKPELCAGYSEKQIAHMIKQSIVLIFKTSCILPLGHYTANTILEKTKTYINAPIHEMYDWINHEYLYWCIETGSHFSDSTERPRWLLDLPKE